MRNEETEKDRELQDGKVMGDGKGPELWLFRLKCPASQMVLPFREGLRLRRIELDWHVKMMLDEATVLSCLQGDGSGIYHRPSHLEAALPMGVPAMSRHPLHCHQWADSTGRFHLL